MVKKSVTKKYQNVQLSLSNVKIHQVQTFKYLGVSLDENLTYNSHINRLIRNVSHKMYMLRRVSHLVTEKACILIYKSFILPHLEYGNILYINNTDKNLSKLQRLQNHCLKICMNLDNLTPTNLVHKKAKLNLLKDRRNAQLAKHMFLRTKNEKFIERNNPNVRQTRSMTVPKLYVPGFKNSISKKSVIYHGSIYWNKLNYNLKQIELKKVFDCKIKSKLKSILNAY